MGMGASNGQKGGYRGDMALAMIGEYADEYACNMR